ncbi:MAG: hypothetical protein IJU95_01310, partial [Treponema sp.]|nr:hypothetical protein [Treponema sp.]
MNAKRKGILQNPFLYVSPSTRTVLTVMLCLLLPQIAMLFITSSYASLLLILSTVLASLLAEMLYGV